MRGLVNSLYVPCFSKMTSFNELDVLCTRYSIVRWCSLLSTCLGYISQKVGVFAKDIVIFPETNKYHYHIRTRFDINFYFLYIDIVDCAQTS